MNSSLQEKYILPSPAGAFYCISSKANEQAKHFLQNLMTGKETFLFDTEQFDNDELLLQHIQKLKWLQGFDQAVHIPDGTIEDSLPEILQKAVKAMFKGIRDARAKTLAGKLKGDRALTKESYDAGFMDLTALQNSF